MHTASVEFDHAFFVRQATEADRVVFGVVLRSRHNFDRGVERVPPALEEGKRAFQISEAIVGAHDDRPLVGACLGGGLFAGGSGSGSTHAGGNGSQHGRLYEITARKCHGMLLAVSDSTATAGSGTA